jgi:hypothetical protein
LRCDATSRCRGVLNFRNVRCCATKRRGFSNRRGVIRPDATSI